MPAGRPGARVPAAPRPVLLGLETSCDETAAGIVDGDRRILANCVFSQLEAHRPYAGVVPEIAARQHLDALPLVVTQALAEAGLEMSALDAIAATAGPGLIGGVMVGTTAAKALAASLGRPFIAVNHLEGHALTARLTDDIAFPYLLLLVSGGHSQLVSVAGPGRYLRLGGTIDDALGEAFDKAARLMGLGYPGGPALERAAQGGDPTRFALPRPMRGRPGCRFSFSGLKTAVARHVENLPEGPLDPRDIADLAAAFQAAAAESVADRTANAITRARALHGPALRHLVVAGGVAANRTLRAALEARAAAAGLAFLAPPPALCTDNGAMIAWAGLERWRVDGPSALDFAPRPRWPLGPEDEAQAS